MPHPAFLAPSIGDVKCTPARRRSRSTDDDGCATAGVASRNTLTPSKPTATARGMRLGRGLVAGSVLWITACVPSREAMSAGQVGCAEPDIKISEERTSDGARSWIATCNDVRYVCSQIVTGNVMAAEGSGSGLTTQVNCTVEAGGNDGAPAGAGGFRFGQAVADDPVLRRGE